MGLSFRQSSNNIYSYPSQGMIRIWHPDSLHRPSGMLYTFNDNFYMGFGQSKLPGNRQRVISSGNQQFIDRSIVNSRFNIDRDFGFFAYYTLRPGDMEVRLKSAITTGDGRNALAIDDGLAYTARMEWLPFGIFKNSGDFSEGDLEF